MFRATTAGSRKGHENAYESIDWENSPAAPGRPSPPRLGKVQQVAADLLRYQHVAAGRDVQRYAGRHCTGQARPAMRQAGTAPVEASS